jgi:hypothetical protein
MFLILTLMKGWAFDPKMRLCCVFKAIFLQIISFKALGLNVIISLWAYIGNNSLS